MTTAERTSNAIAVLAAALSLMTLYVTSCQPANLTIGISESILLNAKPRIGLLANIQNDGAKAGSFVTGVLMWDSIPLELVMTSPKVETWIYPPDGSRRNIEETQFTFVAPMHIQGRTSQPALLWFTRNETADDRLFTSGIHALEVRLFDGVKQAPAVQRSFKCFLRPEDITNIYAKGSEITEFRIKVSLGRE